MMQTIKLTGAIDRHSVASLWEQYCKIVEQADRQLDLQHVERVDSAGVALFLALLESAHKAGKKLTIAHVSQQFKNLTEVQGVWPLLKHAVV